MKRNINKEIMSSNKSQKAEANNNHTSKGIKSANTSHDDLYRIIAKYTCKYLKDCIERVKQEGSSERVLEYSKEIRDSIIFSTNAKICLADPNAVDAPLMDAVELGNLYFVEACCVMGADVNQLYNGRTPLMVAIEKDNFLVIECLIKKGANIYFKCGTTSPFDLAKSKGDYMLKFLLNANIEYNNGKEESAYSSDIDIESVEPVESITKQKTALDELVEVALSGEDGLSN
ncbi:MAG: Ankyrin repeat (3 copies) [Rickettsiaceae bacterium]|jgi:ankyrin repeat protein|nr:Ankyrin repeat (3 copies) [Rickettsiaceae bacterium]